jgi:hypothetical protein
MVMTQRRRQACFTLCMHKKGGHHDLYAISGKKNRSTFKILVEDIEILVMPQNCFFQFDVSFLIF